MEQEQSALSSLWSQFSVALKQVDKVIKRFQEVSVELPELEKQRVDVEQTLAMLTSDLESKKRAAIEEVERHRSTLDVSLSTLRQSVTTERDRLAEAKDDLAEFVKMTENRKLALEQETQKVEGQLRSIKAAFENFKKVHGLV